jgi:hypothetical protein
MPQVRASGMAVVAGSALLTLAFWLLAIFSGGSGP